MATDDVILAKGDDHTGVGVGGIKTHHVVRDVYSGARKAYPMSKRDVPAHAKNFRHFVGLKANEVATKTFIKMDEAGELEQAAHQVGFTPETSLPNRFPHNAALERDIREEKECCRTIHLQSGLPYEFYTHSFPYACLSMSFDRPSLADPEKTQWESMTRDKFMGRRLCFGQLVYYRKKTPSKRTLEPNMSPGLFMGWRMDPGLRYRFVTKILDYQEFRTKSANQVIDVPEAELFVEEGPPIFPFAIANQKALLAGSKAVESSDIPVHDPKEVPFPPEGGIAAPTTPVGPKPRSVYITVERIIKFKVTPGCKACKGEGRIHTDECRARFTKLVEEEKEEAKAIEASKARGAAEGAPPASPLPDIEKMLAEEEILRASEDRPTPSSSSTAKPGATTAGVAVIPQLTANYPATYQGRLPTFGKPVHACASVPTSQLTRERENRRRRRAALLATRPGPKSTMFEFACSSKSQMGTTFEYLGINHVGLSEDFVDLLNEQCCQQVDYQIQEAAETAPPHLWASIPCTSGSPWQFVNASTSGPEFRHNLQRQIAQSRLMFKSFVARAELVLSLGGSVTFEWPRYNMGWKRNDVKKFCQDHPEFKVVDFDGCMTGVKSRNDKPIKKPWRLMTTSDRIVGAFQDHMCNHEPSEHDRCQGGETSRTAFYPPELVNLIAKALYPAQCKYVAPAMPCVPPPAEPQPHRQIEEHLKHVSPLSGYEELAIAVESDPSVNAMVTELLDHRKLLAEAFQLSHEGDAAAGASSPDVINAMVTKLLSRSEMLADPRALDAVRAEAAGLEKAGAWHLTSVREMADVKAEAKASGISVHFGQLMTKTLDK